MIKKTLIKLLETTKNGEITLPELTKIISESIGDISNELNIARIEICLISPKDKTTHILTKEVYSEDFYDNNPFVQEFNIKDFSYFKLKTYPRIKHVFNDTEIANITSINQVVFCLFSRIRYIDMYENAYYKDNVTGLNNLEGLCHEGDLLKKQNKLQDYICMVCDIKDFKIINEKLGMSDGDKLLLKYSHILYSSLDNDEFIGRMSGDNFVILIKKSKLHIFTTQFFKTSVIIEHNGTNEEFDIEIFAGIYEINKEDNINVCIENAVSALNVAKTNKVERFAYYNKKLEDKLKDEKQLRLDFSKALKNNEFVVYYQPKVFTENNKLVGAEALVRWNKDGEMISPGRFIPVFEKDDKICKLDFYMLNHVCADIKSFLDKGLEPVKVSINFSKRNFDDPNFAKRIIKTINSYNIPMKYIEIELVETIDSLNIEVVTNFLDYLHNNEVTISLDDFGTEYSALNLLGKLKLDVIKIDKSLVDNIMDKKNQTILKNILNMIRDLGMDIVVEGVETKEQLDFITSQHHCKIQGFYFDKPMPLESFEKKIINKQY